MSRSTMPYSRSRSWLRRLCRPRRRADVRGLVALAVAACVAGAAQAAEHVRRPSAKTVEEVIERNATARGGLDSWRKVNTMVWLGHLERSNAPEGGVMRFVMELRRPDATRFEIKSKT